MMQAQVNPALGALLQTAQMVTPEQTPTVAAQVAQVAAQKMQPQGIMGGMPQATQDFRTAAQIDNMKRMQMQQAMQQMAAQMTAKPAGIEGLPAQNMQTFAAAQGGVVGYASRGYVDPQFPEVYEDYIRSTGEERTGREEEELFGPMKTERQRAIEAAEEELLGPATRERLAAAPPRPAPVNRPSAPTPRPPTPAPRPPASATRPPAAAPAPTGIAAALAERPQYDVASIPAAGTPYMKAGEEDVARLRKAEGERAAFEKTLPDLSAKGIAALEASEQERQRLLGVQRGDDKFNRQIALLRGFQGDRSAYDRVVANQQARDDLARQAQLSFEQARIKEMQAQQARQLNQFDRAIALEREASALMEKARDNALKAQQIQQGIASAQFQGAVQMYEGAQNRANAMELERMRRATADRPGETERIFNRFNELKAKDPAAAEKYLQDIERIKGAGKGITERQDVNELKALIASLRDQADPMKNMDKASREQASALLRQAQEKLAQMSGLGGATAPTGGAARPSSKAEFDALPKGARYINPADGKEYIKN